MNAEHKSYNNNYSPGSDLDEIREMVAKNAYYRAEKRGFEDGYELDDWLEAEQEIGIQHHFFPR